MKWETVKLGKCCLKIGSGSTPRGGANVYIDKGIALIRSQNVYNLIFERKGLAFINDDSAKKLNNVIIKENDILLNITGDSVARTCIVPKEILPARVNQHVCIIRADNKKLNSLYLSYYLASPFMQSYMLNLAVGKGTSRNAMTKEMISNFDIPCPPIETQRKIANILSAYDDLIENNQKQIKLLEEAAQRLYKEWFVKFKFPGHENVPIVDGLPIGWKREKVGNIIKKSFRSKQVKTVDYLKRGSIPIIDQSVNFISGYTNDNSTKIDFNGPLIVFGDHTRILKYIQFPFAKGADGTQIIQSRIENMPQSLLYCSLVNIDLSNYSYTRHFKYLKEEKIIISTNDIAMIFDKIVSDLFYKIKKKRDIMIYLTEARDRLLPKLMNGEIEVD